MRPSTPSKTKGSVQRDSNPPPQAKIGGLLSKTPGGKRDSTPENGAKAAGLVKKTPIIPALEIKEKGKRDSTPTNLEK